MAQTPLNERLFQRTTSSRREVHFSGKFEFAYYRGPNKMRRKTHYIREKPLNRQVYELKFIL